MEPQKSSKKISVIVAVFVLLIGITIGGYLVLNSSFSLASITDQLNKILEENTQPVTGCQPDPSNKEKDSDNDGLMDWEETTWQTDPCKPDSDGDGYLDGEEVASGYSPIIQAPNDALPNTDPNSPRSLPSNLTQALAQKLAQGITDGGMGQISDALNPLAINTSNQVVNQAIQEIVNQAISEFSLPFISDEEIIISNDNSKKNIKSYARKISSILNDSPVSSYESESEVIYYAVQSNNFTEIKEYADFYKKAAEEIKKIPVPSIFKEVHKEQIGILQITANIHQAISKIQEDPLRANLAIEQYKIIADLTFEMSNKIIDIISGQ